MMAAFVKQTNKFLLAMAWLFSPLVFSDELTVLTYHDVVANPGDDAYAVSRSSFVQQMDYLESNGYKPVSLSQLNRIFKKQESLPKKAVLITFDDGLKSYLKFAVPVLQTYGFPSVLSVVSGWADNKAPPPEYRGKLLSWDDLRKLEKSELVEIISHTHELHTNLLSNPQGNYSPAGVTRIYSPGLGQYEEERVFRQRIAQDLKNSVMRFKKELGLEPIGIAWPYGRYDNVMASEARLLGMHFQLTLDDGPNYVNNLPVLNRIMVMRDTGINDFISDLKYEPMRNYTHKFVEISLDRFIGKNREQSEEILSDLLDEVERLEANTVIVSPLTRDGSAAFFPTTHMRTSKDILNRVTHQLNGRLGIRHIFLRLTGKMNLAKNRGVLNDLSRLAWFNGVVFDNVDSDDINTVRKIVDYYHPKSSFGIYGDTENASNYDFVMLPVDSTDSRDEIRNRILKASGLPTKLFVEVNVSRGDSSSLPQLMDMIRNLGIRHYGVANANDLVGQMNTHAIDIAKETLAVFGG